MSWCLYLLECADGSYYAGITNDLENRIKAHNDGLGAKYTRGRGPVKLLAQKDFENRSEASKAESAIKKLPKSQKLGFFA
jgi:putative endonuclease